MACSPTNLARERIMTSCPTLETLQKLLAGQLSPEDYLPIESHVETCEPCRQSLDCLLDGTEPAWPPMNKSGVRYQRLTFHARGGLGEVHRAADAELEREVALKQLRPERAHDPESRRRFLQEAKITGRLEHPGIVPVYGLIEGADGQPSYAMRFIEGETLQEAIDRFHAADKLGRDPGQRSLELRQLLTRFVAVCNTIAYAHSRGIVHRDLKPGNIMLGKFGETLVVDWGLAKPFQRGQTERATGEETLLPPATESDSRTREGRAAGTPAYMSPEQAAGRWGMVGPASDIYSLGATLYVMLTGQTPFAGLDVEEMLLAVQQGQFPHPRHRKKVVPRALDAICLKAMALRPADRYATALDLARDVEKWLADEQVAAYRESWAARSRRWLKHNRTLAWSVGAAVLVAVVLGGGGWLWVKADRDAHAAQVAHEVNDALNQATALRARAKAATVGSAAHFAQAREQAQRALALVKNGPAEAALKEQVQRLKAELDEEEKDRVLMTTLDEARLAQAETLLSAGRFALERAVPKFREAFRAYGLAAGQGEPTAVAGRIRGRPAAVQEAILAALDEWDDLAGNPRYQIHEPHRLWLRAVLEAVEPDDAWGRKVRAARRESDALKRQAALERLAASADLDKVPLRALTRLASPAKYAGGNALRPTEAVKLLRRAQARYPADFWVNENLGKLIQEVKPPRLYEAVRFLTAAVALRPESPGAHLDLGHALCVKGELDAGMAAFRQAIQLNKNDAEAHYLLGVAFGVKGRMDDCIQELREAIRLKKDHAEAHYNLGLGLNAKGQLDEAVTHFRETIRLKKDHAEAHYNLGVVLQRRGQLDKAVAEYRETIRLNNNHASAHYNLGLHLQALGQVNDSIAQFRAVIRINKDDAWAYCALAYGLKEKGRFAEALGYLKEGYRLASHDARLKQVGAQWLRECERLVQLNGKLPALLAGKTRARDNGEWLELAAMCRLKRLYGATAYFYQEAFAENPQLAENLGKGYRYMAAGAAALAGCGQGKDGLKLKADEQARWRKQAVAWLRADLALWTRQLEMMTAEARANIQRRFRHWQTNPDLAGLRDAAGLARLPAEERAACRKLWAEVEAIVK
jgi:serine/threonine-protein kinase